MILAGQSRFMAALAAALMLGNHERAQMPDNPAAFDFAIGRARIETDPDSPRFGRKVRRCLRKGMRNRRHVVTREHDGKVYTYHATKGWRVGAA